MTVRIILSLGFLILLFFQNCGQDFEGTSDLNSIADRLADPQGEIPCEGEGCESTDPLPPGACQFNGQVIEDGQMVVAYLNSSDNPCQSEERLCESGTLSGSFQFANCSQGPAACLFNGESISSGRTVRAFLSSTVPAGQQCQAQERVCTDGNLSGSYLYASCQVDTLRSCLFNGRTIAHGASVEAYASSTVPFGSSCQPESRVSRMEFSLAPSVLRPV